MTLLNSAFSEIIKKNPLLTKRQEFELSKKAKKGDLKARKKLIESNYRLVISIAKKYHRKDIDFNDLIQESSTGLLKAVDRFDPDLGHKFSTYACWWIKQAATKHITNNNTILKVPAHLLGYARKVYQAKSDYIETFKQEPEPEELADILGIPVKDVKEAFRVITAKKTVSIDKSVTDENARNILDIIPDTAKTPESILCSTMSYSLTPSVRII